ncbi:alpha/beta hydrolase [Staphylococcus sp. 17KM0847]|uniref:alpha/beta hydrolase n=1 Tax=Staphylococcus sp. 17KM0847 TaxID=2583989 RepID=UPI0015DD0CEB|nr:alpha/beta hydrolase [Staphylococcus sp. 17KM0847]QLK86835.1 alpha/beta hydrolase [Staphylococcus sp. 17KM0847]
MKHYYEQEGKRIIKLYLKMNGVRQGVIIETSSFDHPILLVVHGGPGFPLYPFFRAHRVDLTERYTVVFWDQRGTGMSYTKQQMTMEDLIQDTFSLIQYLCHHYHQKQVFLMCHSFGTLIGALVAQRYPKWIAAYIGIGQLANVYYNEQVVLKKLIQHAEKAHHQRALDALKKVELDRYFNQNHYYEKLRERYTNRYRGGFSIRGYSIFKMFQTMMVTPNYTWLERINIVRGSLSPFEHLTTEMVETNLMTIAQEIQVPFYLLQGVYDLQTTYEDSYAMFECVGSRVKHYYVLQHSAHAPFIDERDKVIQIMNYIVDCNATL